jgi:predicted metal-dependent hydrolase
MKFNPDKISEGSNHSEHTSFSINKGEKIVFCLRSKDDKNKLVDLNTMMFVALHELAHVCTESVGHEPEFWDNFRWLLHEAINIGVYKEQDFKSKPVPYCGINITESPLNT